MFQLLNRFAWAIAILGGILSMLLFSGGYFEGGTIIPGIIVVFAIKYLVFSPIYIRSRLEYFQKKLGEVPSIQKQLQDTLQDEKNLKRETLSNEFLQKNPVEDSIIEDTPQDTNLSHSLQFSEEKREDIPSEPGLIAKFFSENILAKVGGIIVFLGMLFFLSIVYTMIGPVAKMVLGFIIGFGFLGAGMMLDTKGYPKEARIVMGTAFLINYLVILSGRYLLGDSDFLSVGTTFIFLILNTLLASVTALVYKSRTLLLFSFVFAYINPLLLGTSSDEPYTLLGYTMIVTLGALFLSYRQKDEVLFSLSFIFAALFFLSAPWQDGTQWITKLICINILGAVSLYVSSVFEKKYQYLSEILIGGTFFLIGIMGLLSVASLSFVQLGILCISSLALMLFCYISFAKGAYLYSIGTLGTILSLSPALLGSGIQETHLSLSALTLITFLIFNIGVILQKEKEALSVNIGNIIGGLISGAVFLTYMIYAFGNEYFPGMFQGFAYLGLALVYSLLAFFFISKIGIEEMKQEEKYKNIFYSVAALGISFFSLAVAFVLSEHKEIVSLIWLLEASVLFFLTQKTASLKVGIGALVLFVIGIGRLLPFINISFWGESFSGDYGFLIALLFAFASIVLSLFFLFPKISKNTDFTLALWFSSLHNLFHILGILILTLLIEGILGIRNDWYSLLYMASVLSLMGYIYQNTSSAGLQKTYSVFFILFLFLHLATFMDSSSFSWKNIGISTLVTLALSVFYIRDFATRRPISQDIQYVFFLGYLFVLSSLYVQRIFDITFAVTIYWGILSFIILRQGIEKNIQALRTIGLYLIVLTAGKVFFYDIWMSVDDTLSRVFALIVVGILMIVLSTMYTRKFGNNLNKEFNLENLFPQQDKKNPLSEVPREKITPAKTKKQEIQESLENISPEGIVGVRMHINGQEKPIQIRAANLIKIAKLIEKTTGKTEFQSGELQKIYENFSQNYESKLPADQYKKIKEIVELFVQKGGKMEFVQK